MNYILFMYYTIYDHAKLNTVFLVNVDEGLLKRLWRYMIRQKKYCKKISLHKYALLI